MAKRVRIYKPGSWDRLIIEDFHCPAPEQDEVKIDVVATGVNFADVCVRQGLYSSAKKFVGWPITPGFEVAGRVNAVGKNVKGFTVGDRVMAITLFNGYSSQVVVKAEYVREIPSSLNFSEAASILGVFFTAYYATCWLTRVHPGSTALIHSAAGGVGLALTQILKDAGCRVVGVVGNTNKVSVSSDYGANIVIDKSKTDLWSALKIASPNGYDLIFDPNGLSTFKQSYNHLAPSGLLFVYGFHSMLSKSKGKRNLSLLTRDYLRTPRFNPFDMVKTNRSVIAFNVSYLFERHDIVKEGFSFILKKFQNKTFKPLPITSYAFNNVIQAHKDIESGKTTGKLVLTF